MMWFAPHIAIRHQAVVVLSPLANRCHVSSILHLGRPMTKLFQSCLFGIYVAELFASNNL